MARAANLAGHPAERTATGMSPRIMVAANEPAMACALVDQLRSEGFAPLAVSDGKQALQATLDDPPSLVLLDAKLSGRDGLSVLRDMRAQGDVPVILLTGRGGEAECVAGLELGADDYIRKPCSAREVIARVKAVLRRAGSGSVPARALVFDRTQWRASLGGVRLDLTRKEFGLLSVLAERPRRIFSRAHLLEALEPDSPSTSERAIDSHVKNLRRKFAAADGGREWIRCVYGVGFCFDPG